MITSVDQAKQAARGLRASLAVDGLEITHGQALEHVAHAAGYRDWNTLSAGLTKPPPRVPAARDRADQLIRFSRTIPIMRIFDEAKAREFYLDYLAFEVDWEHRFEPELPLYMQISRAGLILHLSEHHGDGTPGSVIFCEMTGIEAFHTELAAKKYRYYRPGLHRESYGWELVVEDGFGNGLRFCERDAT